MSVPDSVLPWVQVLSPAFTIVLSGLLAWLAFLNSRRDQQRDAEKKNAEVQAQASKVSAWWGESDGASGVFVKNASDTPIYQTFATAVDADTESAGERIVCGTVSPSAEAQFHPVSGASTAGVEIRRIRLSFTDAAGVRWHRNQYGKLASLPEELRINTDQFRTEVLAGFEEEFKNAYGVKMEFTFSHGGDSDAQTRYLQDMKRAGAPNSKKTKSLDAVICPHDWIGSMVAAGLIDVLADSEALRAFFTAWAIEPLTVDGRLYGLPTTADSVALVTNTRLASVPKSLDELVEIGQRLKEAGTVARVATVRTGFRGDPFQIWPVFASAGGWLFRQSHDGTWAYDDVGIDSPESIRAFSRLREWGTNGLGILDPRTTAKVALDLYVAEKTPFLLTSSDLLAALRKSPVWPRSEVTAVPAFIDGSPATPMTVVHGLVVCTHGDNRITAQDLFADYLTHERVLSALSDGTLAPTAFKDDAGSAVPVFHKLCATGTPIPNLPRMNEIWRVLEKCEIAVISTSSNIQTIAFDAAKQIRALLKEDAR